MAENSYKSVSGLSCDNFKRIIDGKAVDLYFLRNSLGMEVAITNYGAFVVSIMVPDKNGVMGDVVLGHETLDEYLNTPEPTLGCVIGRFGNRIGGAKFTLNGKEYKLHVNNGPNCLHGGEKGFNKKVWTVISHSDNRLHLHYVSPYGEEGFPGMLTTDLLFTVTEENELVLDYRAVTDRTTLVNLTHHSYFNLSGKQGGEMGSVCGHELLMNADHYTPMDSVSIPYGRIDSVKGTPMDFTDAHAIGDHIDDDFEQLKFGKGYDHCYVLNKREEGELSFAARVVEPESGRFMDLYTTEPGVQLYTANWLSGFTGKYGTKYPERCSLCLEAQHFPDSPNKPWFPSVILTPRDEYRQKTVHKFGVIK